MADTLSSRKKYYYVANPGSDSDDPNDGPFRRQPGYAVRRQQQVFPYPQHQHRPSPSQPTLVTTDLPQVNGNGSYYQTQSSYPPLSPDSPASQAAEESTPPPATPGLYNPSNSVDLHQKVESPSKSISNEPLGYYDRTPTDSTSQASSGNSRKDKFVKALKAPFGGRPRPMADSPRRVRNSPTAATPDSYTSPSSSSSLPEKVIFVTSDSERYVTVDISGAKNAAQIRELILTKLNIYNEDEFHPYSIYQTEIGAYAIGAALTNDRLYALCRDHGDAKGTLKFFVSVASATVHEPSPPIQPVEHNPIPPCLPSMVNINPLRVKRRSRSRNGSFSSQSEKTPLEVGYEADLDYPDRESSKSTPRPQPPNPASAISPKEQAAIASAPRRRPSIIHHPRPASPLVQSPEQGTPPQASGWSQRKEEKYSHGLAPSVQPVAPPLSPNRPSFTLHDDGPSTLAVPRDRHLHSRTGSDAASERDTAQKAAEQLTDTMISTRSSSSRARDIPGLGKPSRENMKGPRRTYDEDDPSYEPVPTSGGRTVEEPERISPSVSRGTRQPVSARLGYSRLHNSRPAPPVPTMQQETRPSSQPRPGRQPLPPNFVVTWKGEEGGSRKASPAMTPNWQSSTRLTKTFTKSMDNLKLTSPTRRQQPPQLPVTRPSGYSPNPLSLGTPKSYEPPRGSTFARPLHAQASPHAMSSDFPATSMSYNSRSYTTNLISPNYDPYPRPQSATGDPMTSPTRGHSRIQSPVYGSTLDSGDSGRSPRTVSPNKAYHSPNSIPGPRQRKTAYSDRSDRSSDIQSGPETANTTPPRTPVSPQSPSRYDSPEHSGFVVEDSSPSSLDNPMIKGDRSSDMTLKQEDQMHFAKMLNNTSSESTLLAHSQTSTLPTSQFTLSPPPIQSQSSVDSYAADDDDDDSDNGGGTWIVRPAPKSPRPPLTVQIDNPPSTSSSRHPDSGTGQSFRPEVPPKDQPPSSYRGGGSAATARQAQRRPESTFIDAESDSWAPRPPPENIYDHLERFFPKHDLDKPVIEATSGDTSPTTSEPAAILPPPVPVNDEKARIRAKKSIRIVAQEHKKRIDRTSRAADTTTSYANNMLRKRNTKLWGSRLEEVTTAQARNASSSNLPDSPSGGPTTFKWVRGELIGKGTYGRVYLALNATTGEMIAVKQVELPQTASDKNDSRQHAVVQALKMESETLRDLDHPNIVQYLGFEETPANLSIFLEYVPGGSVGSCLLKHGKFEDNVTRSFTAQILSGLEYLHSKGILHRDLKADNILVEMSGTCKISDFGISKRTEDVHGGAFTAMQGTVFWMAPEVINTQKSGYNFKIDIWSVGCVVLEMWAGMRPWMGEEMLAVMFKLYQSKQPPPVPEDVVLSEEADDFRRKCFAINPDERPTAAELRKHPYLILPPGWVFTAFT